MLSRNEETTTWALDREIVLSHVFEAPRALVYEAWTKSEAFRAAHRDAGSGAKLTLGHPVFEGFETVVETLPA